MSRKNSPETKLMEEIKQRVADKMGVDYVKVNAAFNHFINWQISSFINAEYAAYKWNRFATFFFFNRVGCKPKFPEADEYYNKTRRKDKNRKLRPIDSEEAKVKLPVIEEIVKFKPKSCSDDFKTYYWIVGWDDNDSGWNTETMKREPLARLNECLKYLQDNGKIKETD